MTIKADATLCEAIGAALSRAHHTQTWLTKFELEARADYVQMCVYAVRNDNSCAAKVFANGATTDDALIALARAVVEHTAAQADSRNALMVLLHEPVEPA